MMHNDTASYNILKGLKEIIHLHNNNNDKNDDNNDDNNDDDNNNNNDDNNEIGRAHV